MRITATQIERWADTREAQGILPVLVRRLVSARTALEEIDMPGGDSVSRHGWDGYTRVSQGNAWVPTGEAFWEMSCRKDVPRKFNEDLTTGRSKNTPIDVKKRSSFIFVTARRWDHKQECRDKASRDESWRDIHVIDADDLEAWLEAAPNVSLWFGELLGLSGEGIESIERYWENWSNQTQCPITAEALCAGREEVAKALHEAVAKAPPLIVVEADSRDEAAAFACTQFLGRSGDAQAACITGEEGWRFVDANQTLRTVIVTNPEAVGQHAPQNGITWIVAVSKGDKPAYFQGGRAIAKNDLRIKLDRPNGQCFEGALLGLGEDESDALRLTRSTGRSWSAYRRMRARSPAMRQPRWLDDSESRCLVAVTLIGAWDGNKSGDRECLETITKKPYDELEGQLRRVAGLDDSPILQIGSVWKAKAPIELLSLYGPRITKAELERFFSVAEAVLTRPDPALELEPDRRWMAAVYGKVRQESGVVIDAIVDSLAKLSVYAEHSDDANVDTMKAGVGKLTRGLLGNADEDRWLSLSGVLRELAEASPNEFLEALEASLHKSEAPIRCLLSETGDGGSFGRCWHADLLWALEILGWSPRWLSRVALILLQLSATPVKGNWINTPLNTLSSLFRAWWPQTNATVENRLAILDRLIVEDNNLVWELLCALVPQFPGAVTPNAKPSWRDDDVGKNNRTTLDLRYLSNIGSRLVTQAEGHPKRIAQLVDILDRFEGKYREGILRLVETATRFDDDGRETVRTALRKYLSWHNSFDKDGKKESRDLIGHLYPFFDKLAPHDVVACHTWLFKNNWVELPEGREEDMSRREECLRQRRDSALAEVYGQQGWEGIKRLIDRSEHPWIVGWTLGKARFSSGRLLSWVIEYFPNSKDAFHVPFVAGVLHAISPSERSAFLEDATGMLQSKQPGPEQVATFLANAPFERDTWNYVEMLSQEVQSAYWEGVQPGYLREEADLAYVIDRLVEANRHRSAFRLAGFSIDKTDPVQLITLLEGIRSGAEPEGSIPEAWHVGEALDRIQEAKIASRLDLALLEFAFHHLLRYGSRHGAKNLYEEMLSNPSLFVECICLVYKRKDDSSDSIDESKKVLAEAAWDVLREGRGVPGLQEDGSVNREVFDEWVGDVRRIAAEQDRPEVTDSFVGEWLSACAPDPDGTWPCAPVCDLLERPDAEHIRSGFYTGVRINRGTTSRGYADGGDQERELAAKYHGFALPLQQAHPHMAEVLECLARSYEQEARAQDVHAQQRIEGL